MLEALVKAKLQRALGEHAGDVIAAIEAHRSHQRQIEVYRAAVALYTDPVTDEKPSVDVAVGLWKETEAKLKEVDDGADASG
jgi:hypothetical protein